MQVFLVGIVNFQVYSEVSVCKSQFDKKKKTSLPQSPGSIGGKTFYMIGFGTTQIFIKIYIVLFVLRIC